MHTDKQTSGLGNANYSLDTKTVVLVLKYSQRREYKKVLVHIWEVNLRRPTLVKVTGPRVKRQKEKGNEKSCTVRAVTGDDSTWEGDDAKQSKEKSLRTRQT